MCQYTVEKCNRNGTDVSVHSGGKKTKNYADVTVHTGEMQWRKVKEMMQMWQSVHSGEKPKEWHRCDSTQPKKWCRCQFTVKKCNRNGADVTVHSAVTVNTVEKSLRNGGMQMWQMQQPRGCSRSPSQDKFTFFSFEFEFIATGGRLAKVPNGNLREDDPLIKGPSLQYGRTAGASVQHQTMHCNGQTSL